MIAEKYSHSLPDPNLVESVLGDEAIPELLAEKKSYGGQTVVLDQGTYINISLEYHIIYVC